MFRTETKIWRLLLSLVLRSIFKRRYERRYVRSSICNVSAMFKGIKYPFKCITHFVIMCSESYPTDACKSLKEEYDACFNVWFAEKFLKGDYNDSVCSQLLKSYTECVQVLMRILKNLPFSRICYRQMGTGLNCLHSNNQNSFISVFYVDCFRNPWKIITSTWKNYRAKNSSSRKKQHRIHNED